MSSLRHHPIVPIVIVLSLVVYFPSPANSQPVSPDYLCDDSYGNYTSNSPYKSNLHTLLSSITSNAPKNYGFYNLSVGQNLDQVHGFALCRGDVSMTDCRSCLINESTKITQVCVSQKTATRFSEKCILGYSNVNILKGSQPGIRSNTSSGEIRDDDDQKSFNHTISTLLMKIAKQAALGDYRRKFATGEAQVKLLDQGNRKRLMNTVYALVQCTPNLEEYDCFFCLQVAVNFTLAGCCHGMQRASVFKLNCRVTYDNYRFYGSATVLPPLAPPSPAATSSPLVFPNSMPSSATNIKGNKNKKSRIVAVILIAAVAVLLLVVLAFYYTKRTRKPSDKLVENEDVDNTKLVESLQMDFGTVKTATDNFSNSNRLGHGGFGTVYKGRLSNGQAIAVKRLNKNSGHGKQEFKNEVVLMAKLQHKNLVRFHGFCIQKDEKLLVYELLPNHSLDYFLFDPIKRGNLDWQNRYKIIQGISRGLLYLHEESRQLVVHRDLKPSNILLDTDMTPKISDFSMARLLGSDQSHANTSKIVGTSGYMPPEYIVNGQFSIKTDVFSFGVLVLEIVSGQKVIEFSQEETGESLLSLAWRHWSEGNPLILMDSEMAGINSTEVLRCIHIGLLCVQENAAQRPIMSSVVLILNSHSVTLPVPSRPALLAHNDMDSNPAPPFD